MSRPRTLPDRLLVVRLGAIGDVTNALVFAAAVKDEAPATEIGWVVHPLALPLVEGHPCVDRVHVWRRGGGMREWRRVVGELRRARYPLAVDLQRIAKSALLARASGASRVLGYDRSRAKEGSWLFSTERIAPGHPRTHMVEQYLAFARHLGLDAARPRHCLPPDPVAEAWAEGLVAELGERPIVVHIGASKPENRLAAARYGELARALAVEFGAPLCFTGGPGDRPDADVALAAAGGPAAPSIRDLVGGTSLHQLAALCARSRLFVGCDTGPMHIAAATGARVVALFGPADPLRTGPWGERSVVVRSPPADPDRDLPLRTATMSGISIEDIKAAAQALLAIE